MSTIDDKKIKINALLEEYKAVTSDIQQYTQEGMKCVPYAAILVGLYLGLGLTGDPNRISNLQETIQQYVPYGFILFCAYFLAMVYVREGLCKYRAYLEERINRILGDEIMQLDSKFTPLVTERGFLEVGKSWFARIPTPPLMLGLMITMATILVFTSDVIRKQTIVVICLLGVCAIVALYIYFIYPRLLDRMYKRGYFNKAQSKTRRE